MTANANVVDLVKGQSTLVRPRFSPGLLLRDDDLRVGVDYTRELSRLLFRSLFGCGVVCGLEVERSLVCGKLKILVNAGVALDCEGDPIHVPRPVEIVLDPSCGKEIPDQIWVILCRTEKCCAPRSAACGCDDDDTASVCTREQDGFEIRIVGENRQGCACACEPLDLPSDSDRTADGESGCWCADPCGCHKDHYAGKCSCDCCEGDCVVLALLNKVEGDDYSEDPDDVDWTVNHSVRRFVRPVLMRDPVVHKEQYPGDPLCEKKEPVMAEDRIQHGQAKSISADADVAARAADTAAKAAKLSLRMSEVSRKEALAGRLDKAEAAAKIMDAQAVEAEVAAQVIAERAFKAAVATRQELNKLVARRNTVERAAAAKLADRVAAPDKAAREKAAADRTAEADKAAAEKLSADRAAAEQATAERAAADKESADRVATEAAALRTLGPNKTRRAPARAKKPAAKKGGTTPPSATS